MLFERACKGLSITPEQLRHELADDLDAIASGALTAHGLRLVAEPLAACLPPDPGINQRRDEVVTMLRQHPDITRAFYIDDECDAEFVILTVGIRGKATCELRIPKAKYDGLAVLELIEQHTSPTVRLH